MNLRSIFTFFIIALLGASFLIADNVAVFDTRMVKLNKVMGYSANDPIWELETIVVGSGSRAIIAFHGLGDHAHNGYAQKLNQITDATIYIPDMPYSAKYLNKQTGLISVAGSADIAAAALMVDFVRRQGHNNICLYGFSCGGGIVTNLIYALQNPASYKHIFDAADVDPQQLLACIKVCIVDRPFASFDHSAKAMVGKFLAWIARLGGTKQIVINILKNNHPNNKIILDGILPIDAASKISNMPMLVHIAKNDKIVGSNGPKQLYQNLLKNSNSERIVLVETKIGHVDAIPEFAISAITQFIQKWL